MFIRLKQYTLLEQHINTFFQEYRSKIVSLTKTSWKKEDLDGEGCSIFTVAQYYFGMYIVILIYLELQLNIPRTKQYYIDKYDLKVVQDKLACNGISLSKILEIFGIVGLLNTNATDFDGIEFMGIEYNFIVEPDDTDEIGDVVSLNIQDKFNINECNFLITL